MKKSRDISHSFAANTHAAEKAAKRAVPGASRSPRSCRYCNHDKHKRACPHLTKYGPASTSIMVLCACEPDVRALLRAVEAWADEPDAKWLSDRLLSAVAAWK